MRNGLHAHAIALAALFAIGLFSPVVDAAIQDVPLPDEMRRPLNLAFDPEGHLWFTLDGTWAVARYRQQAAAFDVALIDANRTSRQDSLFGLAIAPDGTVWAGSQAHLHRISPDDLNVTSYALPTPTQLAGGIWIAPEGHVWYALVASDLVVRLDPETGDFDEYALTGQQLGPALFHQQGERIWMTLAYAGSYGIFDPATATVTTADPGLFAAPVGLAADEGGLWVAEHGANTLARVDLQAGTVAHYPASASPHHAYAGPNDVMVGQDGAVWFTEHLGERIARYDPFEQVLYEYDLPSAPGANVLFLDQAPDGSIWYAAWAKDHLGRIAFEDPGPPPEVPDLLRVPVGGFLQAKVDPSFDLLGLPRMEMRGIVQNGRLEIDLGETPAGEYLVLLSEKAGEVQRGRYLTLRVDEQESSPSGAFWMAPLIAVLLLAMRRRA